MKKLLSMLMFIVILISVGVTAFAAPAPSALRGDINFDGKVTAAEARTVLRHAAQLELLTGDALIVADTDDNGKVNVADARMVLRIASKIEISWRMDQTVHQHSYTVSVVTPATCTVSGKEHHKCIYCDHEFDKTIPAAHKMADATCTLPKRCTVCGKTEGAALGHTTTFGRCSRCGEVIADDVDFIEDLVVNFENIDKYIDKMNYYVDRDDTVNMKKMVTTIKNEFVVVQKKLVANGNFKQMENDVAGAINQLNIMANAKLTTNAGINTWNNAVDKFDMYYENMANFFINIINEVLYN